MTNGDMVRLGEVTVPSGTLQIFDVGALALVEAGQIPSVPTVSVPGLPSDRRLAVVGRADGEDRAFWDQLRVVVDASAVVDRIVPVADVIVDFARLLFADTAVLDHWQHSAPIDGRADFVFWGRDAAALADAVAAPALDGGSFGWRDLPVDEVVALGTRAEQERDARGLRLATDFRPHSHHWLALEAARAAPHEAASLDVGPLRVCLAFTRQGDGIFPVGRELDAHGRLVGVRVTLAPEAARDEASA
jgi:hypothetical protein